MQLSACREDMPLPHRYSSEFVFFFFRDPLQFTTSMYWVRTCMACTIICCLPDVSLGALSFPSRYCVVMQLTLMSYAGAHTCNSQMGCRTLTGYKSAWARHKFLSECCVLVWQLTQSRQRMENIQPLSGRSALPHSDVKMYQTALGDVFTFARPEICSNS